MSGTEKISNLMEVVRRAVESGRYLDTTHAVQRQAERSITRPEILQVLLNGYHEKCKDIFDEVYCAWNYAIQGRTIDRRKLRVIISFDKNLMLIITAIEIR